MIERPHITTTTFSEELRTGSKSAFKKLFETYGTQIYNFAMPYLKQKADCEELVQDVFLKIWENRSKIDSSRNLKAYIFKIAVNTIYDLIRKRNIEGAFLNYLKAQEQKPDTDSWNSLIYNEMMTQLDKLVSQLPEQRRRIFLLSKDEGLSNDEIAQKLNLSKRTVENVLYRTTNYLKKNFPSDSFLAILFLAIYLS